MSDEPAAASDPGTAWRGDNRAAERAAFQVVVGWDHDGWPNPGMQALYARIDHRLESGQWSAARGFYPDRAQRVPLTDIRPRDGER